MWYAKNARRLPWRGRVDPYLIWVSEIMLQQTRVETVVPYYAMWIERFPTITALASASLQDVLAAWEGLGYYSRARSLLRAAQIVCADHDGILPQSPAALRKLPGIGRYTAGAISSIVFGLDEPALDGNIRRVLARVFDVQVSARSPAGERILWALAMDNLPPGHAGTYNQALMDIGATLCHSKSPQCDRCPLIEICQAYRLGVQEQRPVMPTRAELPHVSVAAAVIWQDERVLIAQRPENWLLGGLWEFPGGKKLTDEELAECLRREICEELGLEIQVGSLIGVFRHAYTHYKVTLHAYHCTIDGGGAPSALQVQAYRWAELSDLPGYPMGKIDRQIASQLLTKPHMEATSWQK